MAWEFPGIRKISYVLSGTKRRFFDPWIVTPQCLALKLRLSVSGQGYDPTLTPVQIKRTPGAPPPHTFSGKGKGEGGRGGKGGPGVLFI